MPEPIEKTFEVDERLARRIRAAAELGGFNGIRGLARALGAGLSEDTLGPMLTGKSDRPIKERELRQIARVCDVTFEFFWADKTRLPDALVTDGLQRIETMLEELRQGQIDATDMLHDVRTAAAAGRSAPDTAPTAQPSRAQAPRGQGSQRAGGEQQ